MWTRWTRAGVCRVRRFAINKHNNCSLLSAKCSDAGQDQRPWVAEIIKFQLISTHSEFCSLSCCVMAAVLCGGGKTVYAITLKLRGNKCFPVLNNFCSFAVNTQQKSVGCYSTVCMWTEALEYISRMPDGVCGRVGENEESEILQNKLLSAVQFLSRLSEFISTTLFLKAFNYLFAFVPLVLSSSCFVGLMAAFVVKVTRKRS